MSKKFESINLQTVIDMIREKQDEAEGLSGCFGVTRFSEPKQFITEEEFDRIVNDPKLKSETIARLLELIQEKAEHDGEAIWMFYIIISFLEKQRATNPLEELLAGLGGLR